MKLDRNITNPRRGKYALIKLRTTALRPEDLQGRPEISIRTDAIDLGDTDDTDFFVIRLKDKYAYRALMEYSEAARQDGQEEYANEIVELARIAFNHPNRKRPD